MQDGTIKALIELNHQFYQTFAHQFSATRKRLQPGVRHILERIPRQASILDLGCGNGELWRALQRQGHDGQYLGLDFSAGLLDKAAPHNLQDSPQASFIQADLSKAGWSEQISSNSRFDFILSFAVLHHLPGISLRQEVLTAVHNLLAPNGQFIHSEWQFIHSPRLMQRVQDWQTIGLSPADVDPGDYLLDWREGGFGLRYVHLFSEAELAILAESCGFRVSETFNSDGEGGRLGLYQVWVPHTSTKVGTQ
jgi:2-polyprenyl-3-methyl-5-hydroxy-6-metoxy-1,4-benzoquinol methylase